MIYLVLRAQHILKRKDPQLPMVVTRPRMVMLDETRMVPALTPWKGPSLRSGQLVRTEG